MGANGLVQFRKGKRLSNISILVVTDNNEVDVVAYYYSQRKSFKYLAEKEIQEIPVGSSVHYVESSLIHITSVLIVTTLCFSFLTLVLILYVCFRSEKEIKATSVTVSLCMFTGCYLLLLHVYLLLIAYQPVQMLLSLQTSSAMGWHGPAELACLLL